MPKSKKSELSFEASMQALEQIVERMEQANDLSLDESLALFEEGTVLQKTCQKALREAEQRVRVISEDQGQISSQDFKVDD